MRTETDFVRHEKFALIQEISAMLREAPRPVRRAWQEGWTDIVCYPDGYHTTDSCGCCSTGHSAGWYGMCPVSVQMGNTLITGISEWRFICGPNGEEPYYARKAPGEQPATGSCDFEIEIGTGKFRVG